MSRDSRDLIVLGHRGGRGEGWPAENTLPAFERAIAEGADGVELDVRLTLDGEAIVFHDTTLARATGGADARAVHKVAYADLPILPGGERIPRLADVLDAMRGRIVNVELKADVAPTSMLGDVPQRMRLVRTAAAAVKKTNGVDVVFSSFDPLSVIALVAVLPRVPRAILVGTRTPRAATALPLAMRAAIVAAHVDESLVTAARAERLARSGLRVAAWTVNDPARAQLLVALGASWIITDAPGRIVAALSPRR
ncbi:MAG: glpQ [Labilithrix sp.]|nr:glpQ [Labilithrix sp.]